MSKVFIEESTLTSIGDAIRAKGGTTELIPPLEMGTAITNLPTGEAEPVIQALSITENGTYTPPDGVDGFSPVEVSVAGGDIPNGEEVKF